MPLMQPVVLPHSGLRTDSPARQSSAGSVAWPVCRRQEGHAQRRKAREGIVDLRRVTLSRATVSTRALLAAQTAPWLRPAPQADSSGAPFGLASRRPWTAFSALDVDRATPARRRLATNAERQAECGNTTGCISVAPDPADLR